MYPTEAAVKRVEGTVLVEMLVSASGRVLRLRIVESVPMLDAAAVQCARQWEFAPAQRDGRPVPSIVYGEVKFRLL